MAKDKTEPSDSAACSTVPLLIEAVRAATEHFASVHAVSSKGSDSTAKEVTVDMRNCLERAATKLREIIDATVCPVWGEVPESVRDACRKAGY